MKQQHDTIKLHHLEPCTGEGELSTNASNNLCSRDVDIHTTLKIQTKCWEMLPAVRKSQIYGDWGKKP